MGKGEPQQVRLGRQGFLGVHKQATNGNISPLGKGCPHNLVAQTGNANRIVIGKGIHHSQSVIVSSYGIKKENFVLKGRINHGLSSQGDALGPRAKLQVNGYYSVTPCSV
jgi:hypothetical protein